MEGVMDRIQLDQVEAFLDHERTKFAKKVYPRTGYPLGHEMRAITKELNGGWVTRSSESTEVYDELMIPFQGGSLVIERPWMDPNDHSYKGHTVSFHGEVPSGLMMLALKFCEELCRLERVKSKDLFLAQGARGRSDTEIRELTELFEVD